VHGRRWREGDAWSSTHVARSAHRRALLEARSPVPDRGGGLSAHRLPCARRASGWRLLSLLGGGSGSAVARVDKRGKRTAPSGRKTEPGGPMNARITSESQSFRLVERMEEAKISHGQELRADLSNVRVLALAGVAEVQALFCNMGPIRVRAILNRGDDRPLPAAVTLEGLEVPTSGTYDILNAPVSSNGDLRLVVDGATRVVRAAEGVGAPLV